jgi:GNAT superfamily N-acetyltransferase
VRATATPSLAELRIREATTADVPELRTLYDEFQASHVAGVPKYLRVPAPGEHDPTDLAQAVARIADGERSVLLVGEHDGHIVGLAEAYIREIESSPMRHAVRHGHLQSLAVAERLRRFGLGTALLRAAERWARERGATEMRLDIWEFDGGPLGFYEQFGYRTLRRTLVRTL